MTSMPALRPEEWLHNPPQRVAVLRALVLGDLLCATPAWRAIKTAWPECELTLVGLPWAREFAQRLPMIDAFVAFPGYPGLPELPPDVAALPAFLQRMQSQRFDLMLQMHGSGSIVNPLVAACGPRHSAGFRETSGSGTWCAEPAMYLPWSDEGHEIERMLRLTDHLGLPRCGDTLEFPLSFADRGALQQVWPGSAHDDSIVCVHPGAQLASRRWAPERFARVADALADEGHTIVLTGTAAEVPLLDAVQGAMRRPAVHLGGRTSLWTLGALIERAALLVCNDTGVSHVAAALRTPSVVVSCGAHVPRWAPLEAGLHTVLWQDMTCRPCAHRVCPYEHGCATAIEADAVIAAARAMLRSTAAMETSSAATSEAALHA